MLLLLGSAAGSAQPAQLFGGLQGGGATGAIVDDETKEKAFERARRSFTEAARDVADQVARTEGGQGLSQELVDERIESETREFVAGSRERVVSKEGDGMLTWGELSDALAEGREERLDALAEHLRAARVGAEPPPDPDDHPSSADWALATLRYTLLERNAPSRWALCLGVLIAGLALAGLAGRGLVVAARHLDGRGSHLVAQAAERLSGPLYLAAAAFVIAAALDWVWLPVGAAEALDLGARLLVAVSLLWVAWSAADGLARLVGWAASRTRGSVDEEGLDLLRKGLRIGAISVFTAFAANATLGVELTSIFATVGVIGIVASVAAQDTLRNMMGALTVYGDRPFAVGDLVRIKDYFGTVEEIGFRSTRVRTLEGHRVIVPNAEVVREPVENVSARPSVRHHYSIDIVYTTPPDRVRRAVEILEEILSQAGHPEDQPPRVSFEEFHDYCLRLMLWYYSDTSDYWEARAHRSEVNATILERFEEEGIEFAFPTRSIQVLRTEAGVEGEEEDDPDG